MTFSVSVHDALLSAGAAVAAYVVVMAAAQIIHRVWRVRFGASVHLLAITAGLLTGLSVSSWHSPAATTARQSLLAITVVLAAFPIVTLVNRLLWRRGRRDAGRTDAPRVLADATGIIIVVGAAIVALQFVYGVRVPGLLAGSGVVAIILGFALQALLGDLLAGIALHFERPFATGDWLLVEGMHGRVVELSWRSTRLVTIDDVLVDVPNSKLVTNTITNFANPTPRHAVMATIGLHYDVPPSRAQVVLRKAAADVEGVCRTPAPVVLLKSFGDSSIVYEVKVWIDDHAVFERVLSDLRARCWYGARRAGIEIPYPMITVQQPKPDRSIDTARGVAAQALGQHQIFGFLAPEQLDSLLRDSSIVLFSATETIIQQGEAGASMFLLVRGRVQVRRAGARGHQAVVAELGPGDCFGEMSVLTGDPRSATVVAAGGEVEAIEIPKVAFARLIGASPDVLTRLSELLAARQLANAQPEEEAVASPADQTPAGMLRRLRAFFQLGGV
ncbi:MAG TPA: mechanosensitive ion channel family protein [Vicinamibacterales bacterium]|jgi:small-conductance mechanosensitive channel/CRP-like cAMP-binding protein